MAPIKETVKKAAPKKAVKKVAVKKTAKSNVAKKAGRKLAKKAAKKAAPKKKVLKLTKTSANDTYQAFCRTENVNIGNPQTTLLAAETLAIAHQVGTASHHVVTVI